VIINLAVNGRDAMPEGGILTLTTSHFMVETPAQESRLQVPMGSYAALRVADTGTGMSPEVKARIFEPFYTTKPVGKGTGLGLSTVYGIVTQSGGHIVVDSSPGWGTTFTVLFPALEAD
jgi:signal transduction histidine kinase